MAIKYYAYYLKGNKIAISQRDTDDTSSSEYGRYKSPTEAVTDGLEIEYTYSPIYRIESIESADKETASSYETASGFLRFNGTGFSTESTVDYIIISGSGRWNGIHKVTGLNTAHYTTSTKYSGSNVTETPTIYTNVNVLNDEEDEIDLTPYQAKAIVYYLKAKMAEEMANMEMREYYLREFKRQVEKDRSAKKRGPYIAMGNANMRNY